MVPLFTSVCTEKQNQVELTISVAASLKDSMVVIKKDFEKENRGISL